MDAVPSPELGQLMRHAHGQVMAGLLREFGGARLAQIEDAVAQAMLEAWRGWPSRGMPPQPAAWLHRAARHRIIDELRRHAKLVALADDSEHSPSAAHLGGPDAVAPDAPGVGLSDDVHDDELRALFACAVPEIPLPSQLVFALRTLAGFSTRELAQRLLTTEENIQKRYERAREVFRSSDVLASLTGEALEARREAVLRMLYVMFSEGYFSSLGERAVRLELCQEAIRLASQLVAHARLTSRSAQALLALMLLHHARRDARTDASLTPVLLTDQDRTSYHRAEMAQGLALLDAACRHDDGVKRFISKWHFEAAIAAEHAFAPTFAETRWATIVTLYEGLAVMDPSPLHHLYAAVACSYAEGPAQGLARLAAMQPPTWLAGSHLWLAAHADFHARLGHSREARDLFDRAIALAPQNERDALLRRRQGLATDD